jgi:glycosyltransferase involved in cell wall biosynthesis
MQSPQVVDGVNAMVWQLAAAQARSGLHVTLLIEREPDAMAHAVAEATGLQLVVARCSGWRYDGPTVDRLLSDQDLVHMHSVFVPQQATLARRMARIGLPYVITPHGGLSPHVLHRGRARKWVYSLLAERPRFRQAAAVSVVVPGEADDVRAFAPGYARPIKWIPNPIEQSQFATDRWRHRPGELRVAFLGRFDVLHKGLDLLWDIAAALPSVQFDLYGMADPRTADWFAELRSRGVANVHVKGPVFGEEKIAVLSAASLYLQTSRWEGFPVSITEAMFVGVPVAIADRLHIGRQFAEHDLGLTFPADAAVAAKVIEAALNDPARLQRWSARARAFAQEHFAVPAVTASFNALYREALGQGAVGDAPAIAVPVELVRS